MKDIIEKIKEFFKNLWKKMNTPVGEMSVTGLAIESIICGIVSALLAVLICC